MSSRSSRASYFCIVYPLYFMTYHIFRDFLETLDDGSFFTPPPPTVTPALVSAPSFANTSPENVTTFVATSTHPLEPVAKPEAPPDPPAEEPAPPLLPAATKTEKFLLIAADQESGTRDERLNRVIQSKYEAGLLKPYDYVKGYARLSRWMDRK